ncbi:DUF362 domain-containing protein [Dethiobacter alkaliphilus]|uniref:DUF362 domain-containing protein n=1 Tax=Dethiobacter alkaliphilus TaxID=427926 RepID=UPI0022277E22|nr:DUF362 domain-containing protein [Dethiobacter alkaliphilus]MCW3490358.1 DUF362 domain-containing protein [Dethiobacter alkaliphilus]
MSKQVSITRFSNDHSSIADAIGKINGFAKLHAGDRVLLKPNLVMWDRIYPFPKYGVLTTSVVMEGVVRALKEYGCTRIAIGEGAIVDKGLGSDTRAAFAGLGYHKLRDRYGVELVDFNDGPFVQTDFGGYSLDVAAHVLETDFLINLPVLKTHSNTKVSLGFKNLKGCLNVKSKMFCHHTELPLEGFVCALGERIKPALTLIDGIYALEKGPVVNGRAYRTDVLIASTDMFAADVAGARVLGFAPEDIAYLQQYAARYNRSFDDMEVIGEQIKDVAHSLEWDWAWLEDNSGPEAFIRQGIKGIHFPKYDNTICSGCSYLNNYLLIALMGAYAKAPFADMEFLGGKASRSKGGFAKTFLFGKCAIHANHNNPHISEAVPIKGCPPDIPRILETLTSQGIPADDRAYAAYRAALAKRYENREEYVEEHFSVMR